MKVEIREWQGGSTQELLSFLSTRSKLRLSSGRIQGGAYVIECAPNDVSILTKLSGIRFCGKPLKIRALDQQQGSQNPQTYEIKNIFQQFLASRYDPASKLLNLTNIAGDATLAAQGFFNTTGSTTKIFQAIIKVAETPTFGPVVSVSLEQNDFYDIQAVAGLSDAFPKLQNLSLANNYIATAQALNPWKKRFSQLRELVLYNNPISNNQAEIKKVVEFFPRLTQLNGVMVRSEADLPRLPMSIQQNFFENPDIQTMAQNFLGTFFKLWDSDRSQLLGLYDEFSEFSYAWDGFSAHGGRSHGNSSLTPKYISNSRNLSRANQNNLLKFLTDKIAIGPARIRDFFNRLPKSKHDLSKVENFAIEAWQIQGVRQAQDTGVVIAVHGLFQEVGPRAQKYAFNRYMVVLPANGQMLIASDMMVVHYPGDVSIFKTNREDPTIPQAAAPAGLNPQPSLEQASPGVVDPQQAVIQQLMAQTRLNVEYATQCAQGANFDLQQALALFQQHQSQLPQNAFI